MSTTPKILTVTVADMEKVCSSITSKTEESEYILELAASVQAAISRRTARGKPKTDLVWVGLGVDSNLEIIRHLGAMLLANIGAGLTV